MTKPYVDWSLPCLSEGCENPISSGKLQVCEVHYQRLKAHKHLDGPARTCSICGGEFRSPGPGRKKFCEPCRTLEFSSDLWYYHGLTRSGYQKLLEAQGGICAICGDKPVGWSMGRPTISGRGINRTREGFVIDHDHSCCPPGRSCSSCRRGLICNPCNIGLIPLDKDLSWAKKAIGYINRYKTEASTA